MQRIFAMLPAVAESDSTVLIEGESGTGKELVARALHALSPRRAEPLVTVNCGALPDTLLESELFGYKAGAFTDARKDKPGRFALAEGGTLFLDEIGDVSPALQVRLLRVLEQKTYEPLGGTESVKADVRIVTASNKRLADLVKAGTFRQDLYYRINIVRIALPPLRDRREDIPLLVEHFVARFDRLRGKDIEGLTPETLRILIDPRLSGKRARTREHHRVRVHPLRAGTDLPRSTFRSRSAQRRSPWFPQASQRSTSWRRASFTRRLRRHAWNRGAAANELGIHKTTLWRKIRQLGITIPAE